MGEKNQVYVLTVEILYEPSSQEVLDREIAHLLSKKQDTEMENAKRNFK